MIGCISVTSDPSAFQKGFTPQSEGIRARILSLLRSRGEKPFLRAVGSEMSVEEMNFRDFFFQAMAASILYDQFKVPVGATVILILTNPRDVFFAFAGALLTGRVPIISAHPSPKLSLADFSRTLLPLIDNAAPALIVGDREFCAFISGSIGRRVASFEDIGDRNALVEDLRQSLSPVIANPQFALPSHAMLAQSTPLFIQYSSGTTGTKKGVMISESQALWQIDAYAAEIGLTEDDHIVSWLPYYHDMGLLTALLLPLLTATQVTVMSAFDWVKNPSMLLSAMTRYHGTLLWLPNFAYNFLAQAAARDKTIHFDLSRVRGVVNCSEPVSASSHELFLRTFSTHGLRASALVTSYAMAETTFAITSAGFAHPLCVDHIDPQSLTMGGAVAPGKHAIVSSGKALAGTDVRVFDADRNVLGDRRIGEIGVRSPSLMTGYFKNAAATAAAYVEDFFLTGDLGYVDAGEVYVTGRIKDLIITSGRNIYPQDIEALINDLGSVVPGRCVAFGIMDEAKGTENVVVVAERKADASGSHESIARHISRTIISRFDISLADVLVVDAGWLVKSTSGKIARGQNRDRYVAQKAERGIPRAIDKSSTADLVRASIHDVTGIWVDDGDAPLVTSGMIDSLGLKNLSLALEDLFKKTLPTPDEIGYDAYDSVTSIARIVSAKYSAKPAAIDFVVDRQVKVDYVLEGPRNFDALILGSSRGFPIRAKTAAKYGLNAFQFTVDGLKFEEIYCMAEFFRRTNRSALKHIIIGTDAIQFSPKLPMDLRFVKTPALFALLEEEDRLSQRGLTADDPELEKKAGYLEKYTKIRYGAWDLDKAFDPVSGDAVRLRSYDVDAMPLLSFNGMTKSGLAQQLVSAN